MSVRSVLVRCVVALAYACVGIAALIACAVGCVVLGAAIEAALR